MRRLERGPRSVSELLEELSMLLEQGFRRVWLRAEVSSAKRSAAGHIYLRLKDERAVLDAAMWSRQARALPFELEVGLEVLVEGSLEVYAPQGRLQLIVDHVEPAGRGALQLAYEQLKARLAAEGLFAAEAKQGLPSAPRRIGLVTSPQAAALRDMLEILRRGMAFEVLLAPTRVQGPGAAEEIAAALGLLDRAGMDVILLARGGGSMEDLWAFNEEVVARAIAACRTPVIAGIGHETDTTIADLVADLRAATPTHAAEIAVARTEAIVRRLELDRDSLVRSLRRRLERAESKLGGLARHRAFRALPHRLALLRRRLEVASALQPRLRERLRRGGERLDGARRALRFSLKRRPGPLPRLRLERAVEALRRSIDRRLEHTDQRLRSSQRGLQLLDPQRVLERGYSITTLDGGEVLTSPAQASPGSRLQTRLAHGMLASVVASTPARKRGDQAPPPGQLTLFDEETE